MGKAGMVEAVSKGMMSPAKYRILFENDEIGFDHAYVTYQDGNTEALMCCWKFKDGKIIEIGTHTQLINLSGHYAKLWSLQSVGFLPTVPKKSEIKKII